MSIRVLQLSDLEIDRNTSSKVRELLLDDELWKGLGGKPVDYVIFCGNLTADGKKESFGEAEKVLEAFLKRYLPASHWSQIGNRLLLLPGKKDLAPADAPEEELAPFPAFHGRLMGKYKEPAACFLPDTVILKELKDFTIIAVLFWGGKLPKQPEQPPSRFLQLLSRAQKELADYRHQLELADIEYCKYTPTILVSPESPAVGWLRRHRLPLAGIKGLVDFHLFGSSPVWCVFEPPIFRRVGLSTGPRKSHGIFPVRLNLLEISPPSLLAFNDDAESRRSRVSVNSLEWLRNGSGWSKEPILDGSLTMSSLPSQARCVDMFAERLQSLAAGVIPLEFLPGQDMEMDRKAAEGARPRIILEHVTLSDEVMDLAEKTLREGSKILQDLHDATEKLRTRALIAKDQRLDVICVFQDNALANIADGYRGRWLDTVHYRLGALAKQDIPVIYSTTPSEFSATVYKSFSQQLKVVPPLTVDDLGKLLDFYCCFIPIERSTLERLCGRFAGLWGAMLGSAEEEFSQWPGAVQLDPLRLKELPRRAALQRSVQGLLKSFEESMHVIHGWRAVYYCLRARCWAAINSGANELPSISVQEIMNQTGENRFRVEEALKFLAGRGIVKAEQDTYTPGALLFFLLEDYHYEPPAALAPAPKGGWPRMGATKKRQKRINDAFIVYHWQNDSDFAHALYRRLRRSKFQVVIDKVAFSPNESVKGEIERFTRQSRCTIAIVSREFLTPGEFREREISLRLTLDLVERKRRLIAIRVEDIPAPPQWLHDIVALDFTSPDDPGPYKKLTNFLRAARPKPRPKRV